MQAIPPVAIEAVEAARLRIAGIAHRTPLLPHPDRPDILLKLENLQPIGSFKIRGAANAIRLMPPDQLRDGVYTASAGNMAQGVAWCARDLGITCQVIVPDTAPAVKIAAIERLGGTVDRVSFDQWWRVLVEHGAPGYQGRFIHPFADPAVIAGNGTIALELLEDDPAIDTVLVPWGGGGLACGIAAAYRALRPSVRVYAIEVAGAAPLTASFAAGAATIIESTRTFIDGIGGSSVADEIWPQAQALLAGVLTVTVAEVVAAVRELAERGHLIAEGAGAASFAAACAHPIGGAQRTACILSGGNINAVVLATILRGELP